LSVKSKLEELQGHKVVPMMQWFMYFYFSNDIPIKDSLKCLLLFLRYILWQTSMETAGICSTPEGSHNIQ